MGVQEKKRSDMKAQTKTWGTVRISKVNLIETGRDPILLILFTAYIISALINKWINLFGWTRSDKVSLFCLALCVIFGLLVHYNSICFINVYKYRSPFPVAESAGSAAAQGACYHKWFWCRMFLRVIIQTPHRLTHLLFLSRCWRPSNVSSNNAAAESLSDLH